MHESEYHKIAAFQAKHWWFFGRRQFLQRFLQQYAPNPEMEILDLGCGTGAAMLFARRLGYRRVRGLDNAEMAIEFCRASGLANVELGDAVALPYRSDAFDAVLCLDVLEHAADDVAALDEIWRVLKPGGHLFLTVPAFHFLWSRHDTVLRHFRRYEIADLAALAGHKPWWVRERTYFFCFIFPLVALYRWVKRLDRRERTSDLDLVPEPFNSILKILSLAEVRLVALFGKLPFGTSLAMTLQKPREHS